MALSLLPERNCATCTRQEEWGCHAEETSEDHPDGGKVWLRPAWMPLTIDNELVWRCPRRPLLDDPAYWKRLLFHYSLYKDGHLPDEGAVSSQSFKALSLFGVIGDATSECEQDKADRAAEKRARSQ